MSELHAVIMAGGSGTRFWPASRARRPKQFLPLGGDGRSLLQAAVDRCRGLVPSDRIWIVTNATQAADLHGVVADFPREQVVVEPMARDTAPCVALAAARIAARDSHATMLVLPADHRIEPERAFHDAVRLATAVAADGRTLVTFGIRPTHPATGYGYIQVGAALAGHAGVHRVDRFREKPDAATAREYLANGNFVWNAGIFVWQVEALFAAMAAGAPELRAAADAMLVAARAGDDAALRAAFVAAPKTSVDYAVLEHAPDVAVVPASWRWDDLGSFPALTAVADPDAAGNVAVLTGGATTEAFDAKNCVVYAEGRRLVGLLGVEDLVVVAVDDAVLVCPKSRAEDVKRLLQQLRDRGRDDLV